MNIFDDKGYYNMTQVMSIGCKKQIYEMYKGCQSIDEIAARGVTAAKELGKNPIIMLNRPFITTVSHIIWGEKTFKIRPGMTEDLKHITIKMPFSYIYPPYQTTHIMIPWGSLPCMDGQVTNIYIIDGQKELNWPGTKELLQKRLGEPPDRLLFLFFMIDTDRTITIEELMSGAELGDRHYWMPIPIFDSKDCSDILRDALHYGKRYFSFETAKNNKPLNPKDYSSLYNFVMSFFAYLSADERDVIDVKGQKERVVPAALKNIGPAFASVLEHNYRNTYRYFDVGRTHEGSEFYYENERKIKVRFMVKTHMRLQWYGSRADGRPGEEQRPKMIKSFIKGAKFEDESPKTIIVGKARDEKDLREIDGRSDNKPSG